MDNTPLPNAILILLSIHERPDQRINIGTNYTLNPQFNEMTGFTEKDVRDMLEYYSTTCPFNHSVDKLIELIAFLLRNADHQRNA